MTLSAGVRATRDCSRGLPDSGASCCLPQHFPAARYATLQVVSKASRYAALQVVSKASRYAALQVVSFL